MFISIINMNLSFSFFSCSIIEILPHGNGPRARNHHRPSSLQIVGITRSRPVQQRAQHPNDISKCSSPLSIVLLFLVLVSPFFKFHFTSTIIVNTNKNQLIILIYLFSSTYTKDRQCRLCHMNTNILLWLFLSPKIWIVPWHLMIYKDVLYLFCSL